MPDEREYRIRLYPEGVDVIGVYVPAAQDQPGRARFLRRDIVITDEPALVQFLKSQCRFEDRCLDAIEAMEAVG